MIESIKSTLTSFVSKNEGTNMFTEYNKNNFEKIEWNIKTDGFKFKKLSDFFNAGIKTVVVYGFFFTKSDNFGLQPIAITKDCLLNLPAYKTDVISEVLKNADCVAAIKAGKCGLKIREYKSKKFNKGCFDFDFVDVDTPAEKPAAENKQDDIF